jgi:signal transduction histidine kinase
VLQKQAYGPLTEKQKEYVGYILASGQHLLSLVNEILDLSKIEAGKAELELTALSLPQVIKSSLLMY